MGYLNDENLEFYKKEFIESRPFNHIIIDNFLKNDLMGSVAKEFPDFHSENWKTYNNAIEVKKILNHWDKFGSETYNLFHYLNSKEFISKIESLTECELFADMGLNGGGLHTHKSGGKLNTHLDYSLHPKLKLERRINLIIYATPDWKDEWGGFLGFWEEDDITKRPGKLIKKIAPVYNRAVIFDTSQKSWHGLPEEINCPHLITRNSMAIYYLCKPRKNVSTRGKALFAPTKEQENDEAVLSLIERRSQVNDSFNVYGDQNEIK